MQICGGYISWAKTTDPDFFFFLDLDASVKEIFTFENPFNCTFEELPPKLQIEVINPQYNDILKGAYQEKNLIEFCK